ncbi:MAG: O-antigen ligase family protein [Candidatus Gygaella obscura]|nr:O-antigen ligase family protein [Candidatus Gygaella obscura]
MQLINSLLIFLRPFVSEFILPGLTSVLNITLGLSISISILFLHRFKKRSIDNLFIVFVIGLVLSFIFSKNISKSIYALYQYLLGIIIFYWILHKQNKERLVPLLLIAGCIIAFYSLFHVFFIREKVIEFLTQNSINYGFAREFLSRQRGFVPFVSPNLLAGYLSMLIFICGGCILKTVKQRQFNLEAIIYCLYFLVMIIALFFTRSIGAWFSVVGALVCYFLIKGRSSRKSMFIFIVLIVAFIIIFIVRIGSNTEFANPFFSFDKRLVYVQDTLKVIAANPLFGTGAGNFSLKDSLFAHNSYLQIWAELGIVSFLSFLGIVYIFIKEGIRSVRRDNDYLTTGFLLAGLSFLIHNFVDFSFFVFQVSFLWWIVLGFILSSKINYAEK